MQLVPGTMVDRWRVEAEIGRGGMARVYRVRHRTLDSVLALKVLTLGGAELRERLLREGRVQSRLDHPNVVAVRDVLDLPEGPGLLMDYVDGPSLDRWLIEERPSDKERERVFHEILGAVEHAHAQGIVHRDLKPANVLMERRDGGWRPRVTDFGLAKLVGGTEDEDDPQGVQSRTGRPMGTPAYMAPEQVRSAKHVDHRADVFALGCILYELMCGHRAFVGNDSLEVFNRVTQGRFVRPRELVRDLPPRLEAAVLGALALDPEERIPNCAALASVMDGSMPWRVDEGSAAQTSLGEFEMAEGAGRVGGRVSAVPASAAPTMAPGADWAEAPQQAVRPAAPVAAPAPQAAQPDTRVPANGPAEVVSEPRPVSVVAGATDGAVRPGLVTLGVLTLALLAWALLRAPASPPPDGAASSMQGPVGSAAPTSPALPALPASPASPASPALPAAPTPAENAAPEAAEPVQATPSTQRAPEQPRTGTTTAPPARQGTSPRTAEAAPALPPNSGRVEVGGDAAGVVLRSNGRAYAPGVVPAGTYRVEATFGGQAVDAGTADVVPGQTLRLDCRSADLFCSSSR